MLHPNYQFITIEGNIGAGKTSLAQKLAADYFAHLELEEFSTNPFLPKFYNNPERYALPNEIYFLLNRHQKLQNFFDPNFFHNRLVISDYSLHKTLLFSQITLLQPDEFLLFEKLFYALYPNLPQPDLLIYLHAPIEKLQQNIKKRSRSYEQNISAQYLAELENIYIKNLNIQSATQKILLVNTHELDFVNNATHYQLILNWLKKALPTGITEVGSTAGGV